MITNFIDDKFEKLVVAIKKIPILPQWSIVLIDAVLCATAFALTRFIYREMEIVYAGTSGFLLKLLMCVTVTICFILIFKTYKSVFRFSTYNDIIYIFVMLFCTNLSLMMVDFVLGDDWNKAIFVSTLSFWFLNFILTFNAMALFRVIVRLTFEEVKKNLSGEKVPVWVYGTSSSDVGLCEMIKANEKIPYQVKGFISKDKNSVHKKILNQPIIFLDDFYRKVDKYRNIKAILINSKDVPIAEKHILSEVCFARNIELLSAPSIDGQNKKEIQKFNIEDLLGREPITIDYELISNDLNGKNVLVTGAAGSIGSEIVRQLCSFEVNKLILCDIAETPLHNVVLELQEKFPNTDFAAEIADVRNERTMRNIFEKYSPQHIYHAAAYKHVPMMEIHPKEAVNTNVFGTKNVADLAVEFKAECFVMISTDKAVNPSNVMGASKRSAEIYVRILSQRGAEQKHNTRFIITRFGNVLGSNGSVVPLFAKQIKNGGPITVTHPDIIRYFMTIPEACSLVLEAGNLGKGGEIFVFDMGEPVRIKDMAEEMIKLSGLLPYRDIDIKFTGLRKGEKLYEEILYDKNGADYFTKNKKIMIGKVRFHDEKIVLPRYDALLELCKTGDNLSVVKKLKEIVPEFISKNSEYEVLDK